MAKKLQKKSDSIDNKELIKQAKQVIKNSENLILQLEASIKATKNLLVEQRKDFARLESETKEPKVPFLVTNE
jgi:1-acyl-sn-glycerol-3-phosphate acyltransferase